MSIVVEPDTSRQRKKPQDYSFFDYESQLPQDRLQQQPATAPEVPKPQPQERTPQMVMKEMFAFTPKRPTYDPARPEEMKRLAKASAIGKGLNVVGDIIGLSAGANVNKRQDDNKEERYLNSMYNYLDDYTRRLDNWNYQDFANKMRLGQMELQQANQRESLNENKRQFDEREERYANQTEEQLKSQKEMADYRAVIDKELIDSRKNASIEEIKERAKYSTVGTTPKTSKVQTKNGVYEFQEHEYSGIRDEAIRNSGRIQETDPKLFEQLFEETKDNAGIGTGQYIPKKTTKDDDIVRAYIETEQEQAAREAKEKVVKMYMNEETGRPEPPGVGISTRPPGMPEPEKKEPASIFDLIQSGDIDEVYFELQRQGYSDEEIKQFLDETLKN
jgi:hypothetical protein